MASKYKKLEMYHKPGSPLYSIRFIGGGELPHPLKSEYTSAREAQKWIDLYYTGKLPKTIRPLSKEEEIHKAAV